MTIGPPVTEFTTAEIAQARLVFRERIDSLEQDINRCFWTISEPGAPGPAFFPAVMYCFATLDYFSSHWEGWNQRAPKGRTQTNRMALFEERYLLYGRKESQIAIHLWRHKLMHTAEPRLLRDKKTGEEYSWSIGDTSQHHMLLRAIHPKKFDLYFCPPVFVRDFRVGVFGPDGYFHQLRTNPALQANYRQCVSEFGKCEVQIDP